MTRLALRQPVWFGDPSMGSQAPSIRANARTLSSGRSRQALPGAPPRLHRWPFAALGTRTAGLVAKAADLFGVVRGKSVSRRWLGKLIAQLAVFSYLLSLLLDWNGNFPLLLLASCTFVSALLGVGDGERDYRSKLIYSLSSFLLSLGLSVAFSNDMTRSVVLSVPLLPAIMLFFLIYEYFDRARDLRYLYVCFSIVALGLASALLWTALTNTELRPAGWIAMVGSPILIVPNDVAFLAVIAPLSLALVYLQPRSAVAILALTSMILSLCVAMMYLSRTATAAFLVSVLCTIAALRSGRYVFVVLIGVVSVAGIDFLDRPSLLGKFLSHGFHPGSGRLDGWAAAWAMFVDAPLFGHGLHTYDNGAGIRWAHNLYLQTLAEQGIVGLLALLLLLSYATLAAWKAARSPVREQRILAAGALGALVGFCAASVVELTLLREWVVLMLFLLVALAARIPSARVPFTTKED